MALPFCILLLVFKFTTGSVLLWSGKDIVVPALSKFTNDDFKELLYRSDNPQIVVFGSKTLDSAHKFQDYLANVTSSYIINTQLTFDNVHKLLGNDDDSKIIEDGLKQLANKSNKLVVLVIDESKLRVRRKTDSVSTTESSEVEYVEPITGPILYSAVLPTDKTVEAMIYSSKPPLLKINGNNINLGDSTISSMDIRDAYTRLVLTIPISNGKISLRFRFDWLGGYWYFNFVEVVLVDADPEVKKYNLTLNTEVMAPRRFSYHCGGSAVFIDAENNVELHLFDVQAQPDAHNHRFSDAYNCVPFTTVPIWSGIFVTFIMGLGLLVGLTALNSIKTMDKFDNHKTKQLSITVWE
ncbi:hypothetical protein PPYR_11485 [Photinus pyralis]|uniref:Uncharacterized protein n=1 Tax=Photinus pyralis TaxID=7054 RepID=A0A1Y1M3F0_PHOPY|nr:uncharacterized protein LOC116175911 [Photinus pyralis]XP_031350149.1 uncharacterized protein LOC116175911 [Photinus pyralis]KAB0794646.1 hypothetical protein PPYR_11485 [Photinus pyralis]